MRDQVLDPGTTIKKDMKDQVLDPGTTIEKDMREIRY